MLTTEQLIARLDEQHGAILAQHDKADRRAEEMAGRLTEVEQTLAQRSRGPGPAAAMTLGGEVTNSEQYRTFITQMGHKGAVRIPIKNAITSAPGSAGDLIAPDRQREPIMIPRRRLTVRDLLASGETSSNLVQYMKQTGRTNAASVVTEGHLKPRSDITWTLAETPIRTIATWVPITRQAMDDASQLQSLVDTELRYFIGLTEEEEILYGDGSGEHIQGLSTQVTDFNPPFHIEAHTMLDTILLGIAQAQQSRVMATGIVVNDMDWKKMQSLKDSQERYIGGGPFGTIGSNLWTLPVVDTPAMTEGEFMVGAFAVAAQVIDRMQTEVLISSEASYPDGGNTVHSFVQNMLVVRAEERVGLAVKIPEAIVYGDYESGLASG